MRNFGRLDFVLTALTVWFGHASLR